MKKYTTEQLQTMLSGINGYDNSLDYLVYEINDEDFFRIFFEGRYDELARAISYGKYKYTDEYVTFNGYGNLETIDEYEFEARIEEAHDEIVDRYVEMVNDGYIEDYDNFLERSEEQE